MVARKLAAILALDVVGYSHLMAADELTTLEQLNALKTQTLFPAFEKWNGRVFKEMGDGLLAEFASVVEAVECGHEIQKAAAGSGALPLRIGIHFGEIIVENDDLFGDTVNIAARIESVAEPGSVWLSEQAYELVGTRVDLEFRPLGPHALKNIPAPVQLYSLGAAPSAPMRAASPKRLTIAALACLAVVGLTAMAVFLLSGKNTSVDSEAALPGNLQHAQTFSDCEDCPQMIAIGGGRLLMGAPAEGIRAGTFASDQGPQRVVKIAPFAVGKFEVTRQQFSTFLAQTDHKPPTTCRTWEDGASAVREDRSFANPGYAQEDNHPAVCLSWHEAQAYATWLARKTGKPYRLLSEAEWEFAARAGTSTRFFFGEGQNELCKFDNIGDATAGTRWPKWETADCSDGRVFTGPVGTYSANPFGLFDIYGNAREWVADCWHNTFVDGPNTSAPWDSEGCKQRVVRGGSWDSKPSLLASSWRGKLPADHRDFLYGFRLARDLSE